jgi:hypothetical protein
VERRALRSAVLAMGEIAVSDLEVERQEEIARQRAVVKRNSRVPYEEIARAVKHFEDLFPGQRVTPLWYGGRVLLEVWDAQGKAKVYAYKGEREVA